MSGSGAGGSKVKHVNVDYGRAIYRAGKVLPFLRRRCPNPAEAYLVARCLCVMFETVFGVSVSPAELVKFESFVREAMSDGG